MSFILDALRKAERDRSLGQAPRMEDVALARENSSEQPVDHRRRDRIILVTLLLLLIGAGSYLLLRHQPAVIPAAPPAEPQGVVTATVRGPASVTAVTPAPARIAADDSAPPALVDDGSLATLDDLDGNTDGAPPATAEVAPEPEVERRGDFVAHPTPTIAASEPEPAAAAPREPRAKATAAAETTSSSSGATPLDDMPNDYRADFPTLSVEVHVWDSTASKRFVMVNGRRYHEGDTLAAGPRLAEIAQDGLVLDYHGSRVLLSLLQ